MATANDLLHAISRAFVLTESRSADDPELLAAYEDIRDLQHTLGWQVIRVGEDDFTVFDEIAPATDGEAARLRDALAEARIRELRVQDVLEPELWDVFLRRLHPGSGTDDLSAPDRFRGLEEFLGISFDRRDGPLRGMARSIQALFHPGESGFEAAVAPSASPSLSRRSEPRQEEGESGPVLPPDLQGKVEAFFSTSGPEKEQLGRDVLAEAARMKDARNLTGIADLLEVLAEVRGDASDPHALDLARQIISPGTASHIVARLGAVRNQEGRERLVRITSGLGREMARSLADALGEARDRYQRRSFLEALSAQGDLAVEVAREMVEDPRWFVVRNGVSLMGEVGGDDVISHLTGPLANQDPRVRRETVLALAKLGGADAEQLLLGMLGDSEPEVRAMACRGVGVLRVEKALRPLMRILDEDSNEDVQVECLQALGKLGDPGAVPLIEKRALGGLFSRPSKEIRVAAYRALAGIGTPHARSLLEKAANDSDAGIRTVVQGLLA